MTDPINDEVGGQPIVVLPTNGGATVFSVIVDGNRLQFEPDNQKFIDRATRSTWSATGSALSGLLQGAELEPVGARTTFWFALVAAFPEVELYRG